MHVFISAGEPSGDLHGANLIRALRAKHPGVRITGFGGPKMQAAGADLLFDLTSLAVMWFGAVIAKIRTFVGLAKKAEDFFGSDRPDAVVLIDYPGFNFQLAKRAKAAGIPVWFFVPPQLWAWAGWRVKKVRRWFTGVMTALPFEDKWYRERGVNTHYTGHPYYDELGNQELDAEFIQEQRSKAGRIVAVLPGSRNQEVARNFEDMLKALSRVHAERPDARFLVASFNEHQAEAAAAMAKDANLQVEFHVGRTPEIIELAECCLSVSGSVSLEMMWRLKPAAILYKVGTLFWLLGNYIFLRTNHITLVNLLAGKTVFPEFPTCRDRSKELADHVLEWLNDPETKARTVEQLRAVREEVGRPGACDRAAEFLIEQLSIAAAKAA
jgi:lipid-A-disaccharide synthase